ncbi:MAG: type IX secretion system plug protein domain-containing protein [Bacteroidota bacterium]
MKQLLLASIHSLVVMFIGISCVPLDQNSDTNFIPKKITYSNKDYNQSVGAILLYNQNPLDPPVADLRSNEQLILEFDLFEDNSDYINLRLIHCDANWNKSKIPDLQYLDEFNQFLVTDYQFSENTAINYVHYKMVIPKPKISGNYIIAAHRGNNKDDLLFTRRFLITERLVSIESSVQMPRQVQQRNTGQELVLKVIYENINSPNPQQELFATVRQNYRWDNAKVNLKANNNLINSNTLEFQTFDNELTFPGGNEFRLIDLRSKSIPGMNVANVRQQDNDVIANSRIYQPFIGDVYTRPVNEDMNGNFFHSIVDLGADPLEVDYVYTTFNIDLNQKYADPIYLVGRFNSWDHDSKSLLVYNETRKLYQTSFFLKQGVYEFTVESVKGDVIGHPLDKSFRLTENMYDVIVYQKVIGNNYDRIVGYYRFTSGRN